MKRRAMVLLGAALAAAAGATTPARAAAPVPAGASGGPDATSPPAPPPSGAASANVLRLAVMPHSGDERRVLDDWVAGYRRHAPGVSVDLHAWQPPAYKTGLRQRLAHDADVADVHYWFAGARLAELAADGLVAPLDELWRDAGLEPAFGAPLQRAVSWRGRPYAVPLNYYQWGFYYRRSTFERAGLVPPRTWDDFLAMADRARAAGLAPTAVGAADTWTLAAWFDYFDLRLNGLAFHLALADGEVPFTDARVRRVFEAWRQARARGLFLADALPLGWREAIPFLLRERAATLLMGNFFEGLVPPALRGDIGFFPFPRLDPHQPAYEDAPVDVLVLATRAAHPAAGRDFLRWAATPAAQSQLARASGKLPTHREAPVGDDPLALSGATLLRECAGLAQFFDRDAPAALAQPALEVFGAFMSGALTVDGAMARLEAARQGLRRAA